MGAGSLGVVVGKDVTPPNALIVMLPISEVSRSLVVSFGIGLLIANGAGRHPG